MTGEISTHTPHARRDCTLSFAANAAAGFLLTRLMRGVTKIGDMMLLSKINFYSHASCEA